MFEDIVNFALVLLVLGVVLSLIGTLIGGAIRRVILQIHLEHKKAPPHDPMNWANGKPLDHTTTV